jgi:hypothetical protein
VTKRGDTFCLSALEIIFSHWTKPTVDPVKNATKGYGINDISVSYLNSGSFEK